MIFCTLHREVGFCLARLKSVSEGTRPDLASQLEILESFESRLEQLTLKCETSVPLHVFTALVGSSVASQLRFAVQAGAHLGNYLETDLDILSPRESLLQNAVEILGYDAELHSNQALQVFLWHPVVQFPFNAFVFVLQELRNRLDSEKSSAAWIAVNRVYEDHPEFVTHGDNPLFAAAGDLAVRAWDATVGFALQSHTANRDFDHPVESHALGRLREQRAQRRELLAEKPESSEKRNATTEERDLEWTEWQQMLHDAGYWQSWAST